MTARRALTSRVSRISKLGVATSMLVGRSPLALLWGALLAAGCGAEDASSAINTGGQTGSLVPPTCQEASLGAFVVPEGKTAFVESWHEFSDPVLTDHAGNVIEISLSRDANTSVIQSSAPLPAGDYRLTYTCGVSDTPIERTISVAAAAPLPTAFGELELAAPNLRVECSALQFITLTWTPPGEFLPYLDLVQLTFWIDGVEVGGVPLTKPLTSDIDGNVLVEIPHCEHFDGTCGFMPGTYTLHAQIAGQSDAWVSPAVAVDEVCIRVAKRSETEDMACTLGNAGAPSRGAGWWFVTAVGCAALRRAKRRDVAPRC